MLIFFVAVVSIIAGAILVGLGVFFFVLLKAVRDMSEATKTLLNTLQPVLAGNQIPESLNSIRKLASKFGDLVGAMQGHTTVLREFNKLFLGAVATPEANAQYRERVDEGGGVTVESADSFYAAPSDEAMAAEEAKAEARKVGIEVDADNMDEQPDVSQMRGSAV